VGGVWVEALEKVGGVWVYKRGDGTAMGCYGFAGAAGEYREGEEERLEAFKTGDERVGRW